MYQENSVSRMLANSANAFPAAPAGQVVVYSRRGGGMAPLAPAGAWALEVTGVGRTRRGENFPSA